MVVGLVPEQALGDLEEVVLAALTAQLLARDRELRRRLLEQALLRVQLGKLDPRRDVFGIHLDELHDRPERVLGVALAVKLRRDGLEVLHRFVDVAALAIELGELQDHVDATRVEL